MNAASRVSSAASRFSGEQLIAIARADPTELVAGPLKQPNVFRDTLTVRHAYGGVLDRFGWDTRDSCAAHMPNGSRPSFRATGCSCLLFLEQPVPFTWGGNEPGGTPLQSKHQTFGVILTPSSRSPAPGKSSSDLPRQSEACLS